MRIIPITLHKGFDHLLGIVLILFPFLLDIREESTLSYISITSGILIMFISYFTERHRKSKKLFSVKVHLWLDSAIGSLLIFIPLLMRPATYIWVAHSICGIALIILAIITENTLPNEFKYY